MIHSKRFPWRERWLGAVVAVAAGVSGACQSSTEPSTSPPGGASDVDDDAPVLGELVPGPEIDLGSSVPASQLALAADANGFRGGYLTHRVSISEGMIDVTPRSFDRAQRRFVSGGPIGLATTAVSAGGGRLDAGAGAHALRGPNAVRIARGAVVEEIANREDGIEQSWHFAAAPPAGADLVVQVGVSGQELVAANETGLHFRSAAGLGVRYSHAIWRDAAGAAYDVPVRFEDGQIVIAVPEDVVQTAAYPAVLDPTITAEMFTDVPANGTTGASSRNQDAASDGSGYFVVWQDQRDDRYDDIFGARVSAAGAVIDTVGIRLNAATGTQQNPVVAYVGNGYLVAWEHVIAAGNSDIEAAFVSSAGAVTQLGAIASTAANETGPAIAGRGSEALVAWGDGADVRGAVWNGTAFGAAFAIAAGANLEEEPAISANPSGDYLVAFTETVAASNKDVRGQLVTAAGAPSGAAFSITTAASNQSQAAAAFDGTNHVVAWTAVADVAAARVSAAGALLDATPVTINASANGQVLPDVACTAAGCLIAWQDSRNASASVRDIYGAAVAPDLTITANDIAIAGAVRAQDTPALAVGGAQYLATWADNRDLEYYYVRGARMTGAGAVTDADGFVVARAVARHQAPAITQSTSFSHVFMSETQAPDVNVVSVRFTNAGAQQDATPTQITPSAAGAQTAPAAAIIGGAPFAVWQDTRGTDRDIRGSRVSLGYGLPLDPASVAITTAAGDQYVPRIASAGSSALVVWQDRRNGASTGFDIYGAIVSSTGAVTVADIPICTGAGDQGGPAVAYDSTTGTYLVVWSDPSGATVDIRGARVSSAGALLDASCGTAITSAAGSQFGADLTYGNGRFMVVWEDRRNDAALGDIYGARVTVSGGAIAVQDPAGIPIAVVAGSAQTSPTVAFGTSYAGSYFVAWADARNAGTTGTDLYGTQVTVTSGIAASAFALSATAGSEGSPKLVAGPGTAQFSLAYSKENPGLGTARMQFRRISLGTAAGQPCSSATQCESGFCVDGRCCDSACGGNVSNDCQACSVARGASADGVCTIVPASFHLLCRDYAVRTDRPQCDLREYCNGVSPLCPPDIGGNGGAVCVKADMTTGVCPAADASGAPHFCQ